MSRNSVAFIAPPQYVRSNLFVGKVPYDWSDNQLRIFLNELAGRECVFSLFVDRRSRSYCAFAKIDTEESLVQIIAKNNQQFSAGLNGRFVSMRLERRRLNRHDAQPAAAVAAPEVQQVLPWSHNPYSLLWAFKYHVNAVEPAPSSPVPELW